jgi:hypothetical protein
MIGTPCHVSTQATMPTEITHAELLRVRDWANGKLTSGGEQPWSTFLLTRLGETIDALLVGMAASEAERSKQASPSPRLVVSNAPPRGDACRRPGGEKTAPRLTEPAI